MNSFIDKNKQVKDALNVNEVSEANFKIFEYQQWNDMRGLEYLVGIAEYSPDYVTLEAFMEDDSLSDNQSDSESDNKQIQFIKTLSGGGYITNNAKYFIAEAFVEKLESYKSIWSKKEHSSANPPIYYIQWAHKNAISIPWLDYVVKKLTQSDSIIHQTLLENIYQISNNVETEGKRNQQIQLIKSVIDQKGEDRFSVKNKREIEKLCLAQYPQKFTTNSFKKAWQAGVDGGHFKHLRHNQFSSYSPYKK